MGAPQNRRVNMDAIDTWTGINLALGITRTPGHAGHLCFWQPTQKTLVAADMVAEDSTIIIEPHDGGELAAYMASLKRLIALGRAP